MKTHRILKLTVQPVLVILDSDDPETVRELPLPPRDFTLADLPGLADALRADLALLDAAAAERDAEPQPVS